MATRILLVVLCLTAIGGQAHGRQATQPAPTSSTDAVPTASVRNSATAAGRLPRPLPLPDGPPDEVAATLARVIAKGGPEATPALVTALLTAGFGIREYQGPDDRAITQVVRPGQGLILDAWEIAMMADAYGRGSALPLTALVSGLSTLPALKGVPLAPAIVASLRTGATSASPSRRFLARLMVELGRYGRTPYDLLAEPADVAAVRLDPIQLALLLTRLAGDGAAWAARTEVPRAKSANPFLQLASYRSPAIEPPATAMALAGTSTPSCSLTDLQSAITDWAALGESSLFNLIWQFAAEHGGRNLQTIAAATPLFGSLVTVAKMILVLHSLQADVVMTPSPLERAKAMTDGKDAWLTATVRADMGKWQHVNCYRFMLNLIGADADVPNDGVLAGVGVFWRVLDGPVMFGTHTPDQPGRVVSAARHVTDAKGISRIQVIGRRQATDLTRVRTRPVERTFTIGVDVQLKGRDIDEDIRDLVNSVVPHLLAGVADPLSLIADGVAETAFRSFQPAGTHELPLKDWELCDGWHGTITHSTLRVEQTRTQDKLGSVSSRSQRVATQSTTTITKTLHDSALQNDEMIVLAGDAQAAVDIEDDRNSVGHAIGREREIVVCSRSNSSVSAHGTGSLAGGKVSLVLNSNGTYRLEFDPLQAGPNGFERGTSYLAPGCGRGSKPLFDSYFRRTNPNGPAPAGWGRPEFVTGTITDRNIIRGRVERPGIGLAGEATVTVTWDLSRSCDNGKK